ncbi:hypothetical protein F4861DRAFT_14948 [Xylaria intraflava]|nr:hypothetical protein F4861DRAFT_14948 [Xylaria intraflava]
MTTMSEQQGAEVENGWGTRQIREKEQSRPQKSWSPMTWIRRVPPPGSYPPISSIPKTSPERLALASVEATSDSAKTILYLAYGSNLSAKTFLGVRGIRPISQINVSAPAFELTFDLPGIPYNEPCFANTRPRRIPKLPLPGQPPHNRAPGRRGNDPVWSKGLYGVVYEVTPEDYATIIKTEGGGNGYHDVLTPCFELPPALQVPEKPLIPDLPKPFLAHTLYAPPIPDLPGDDDDEADGPANLGPQNGANGDDGKDPRRLPWLRRLFLRGQRHDPNYAQASPRYLGLIRDGAREHALPEDFQIYLAQLQAYTMTRTWQRIGNILFLVMAMPLILAMVILGRVLADDAGRTPRWVGFATNAQMNLMWIAYDAFFKPVFGDGERTIPEDEDADQGLDVRRGREKSIVGRGVMADGADEKDRLLDDW